MIFSEWGEVLYLGLDHDRMASVAIYYTTLKRLFLFATVNQAPSPTLKDVKHDQLLHEEPSQIQFAGFVHQQVKIVRQL